MKDELAPILLFVYDRPEHTRRLIHSLSNNREANDSTLYIFSDAAKDSSSESSVREVRLFIHQIVGFSKVIVVERESNWGLAKSIIDGVTSVVNKYGKVIVLEDDLVVAPHFLKFMNDALISYQGEPNVGHIQACDFTNNPNLPETFLIKWTGSWGWATWRDSWKYFEADGNKLLTQLKERKLTRSFDFNGAYPFTRMLEKQCRGLNNSWAIRWNASLFLADVLSLNVGRSLVENRGFDGSGTHCGGQTIYQSALWQYELTVDKITPIKENQAARAIIAKYYSKTNSFCAKAIRRVKRILNI